MSQGTYVKSAAASAGILAGAFCAYHVYNEVKKSKLPTTWKEVGTLKDIFFYPIKSCGSTRRNKAECTFLGLKDDWLRDRIMMVVDEKNHFVTARVHPKLLLIQPTIENSILTLRCKDMETLEINLEEIIALHKPTQATTWDAKYPVYDLGWEVSEWLSRFARYPGAKYSDTSQPLYDSSTILYFTRLYPHTQTNKFLVGATSTFKLVLYAAQDSRRDLFNKIQLFSKKDNGAFADEVPFNLINLASIDDLNTRLNGIEVSHKNFRANFLLTGAKAYDEDNWKFVKIGENIFEVIKDCTRCVMTTNNPETGVRNPTMEPLTTLRRYRQHTDPELRRFAGSTPRMGLQMVLRSNNGGTVSTNDPIYIA